MSCREEKISKPIILSSLSQELPVIEQHYRRRKNLFAGGAYPELDLQVRNVVFFFDYGDHSRNLPSLHNRYSLIFNLSEPMRFFLDDVELAVRPDNFVLVFPFQKHSYGRQVNCENHKRIHIMFDLENVENGKLLVLKDHVHKITQTELKILKMIIQTVIGNDYAQNQGAVPHLVEAFLEAAAGSLNKKYSAVPSSRPEDIPGQILAYVLCNLNNKLCLKKVSDHFKISESHLRMLFRRRQGRSFGKFLRNIKLFNAMEMLSDSNLTVAEIAEKYAYADGFSFSRAFKKELGISPRDYRKRFSAALHIS